MQDGSIKKTKKNVFIFSKASLVAKVCPSLSLCGDEDVKGPICIFEMTLLRVIDKLQERGRFIKSVLGN